MTDRASPSGQAPPEARRATIYVCERCGHVELGAGGCPFWYDEATHGDDLTGPWELHLVPVSMIEEVPASGVSQPPARTGEAPSEPTPEQVEAGARALDKYTAFDSLNTTRDAARAVLSAAFAKGEADG